MSKGYVYILTNPSMPGVVKIGRTTRSPEQRCAELWNTGVPTPFAVHASAFSPDCVTLEQTMHMVFRSQRVTDAREFFRVSAAEAEEELRHFQRKQVDQLISEFLPDHRAVHESIALDEEDVVDLGGALGIAPADIVQALSLVEPSSLSAAVDELRRRRGDFL